MGRIVICPGRLDDLGRELERAAGELDRSRQKLAQATGRVRLNLDDDTVRAAGLGERLQRQRTELGLLGRRVDEQRNLVRRTVLEGIEADWGLFRPLPLRPLSPVWRSPSVPRPRFPVLRLPPLPLTFPRPLPAVRMPFVRPWSLTQGLDRLGSRLRGFPVLRPVGVVGSAVIDRTRGLIGRAVDWTSRASTTLRRTADNLVAQVAAGATTIRQGLMNAIEWGRDRVTHLLTEAWNDIWDGVNSVLARVLVDLKACLNTIVETSRRIYVGARVVAGSVLGLVRPVLQRAWTHMVAPALVFGLQLGKSIVLPHRPNYLDPFGTYGKRHVGDVTVAADEKGANKGRRAVSGYLALLSDDNSIRPDEFMIVKNGDNSYTVLLPGVTDLSAGGAGFDPFHRSVRDLDMAAVLSAGSSLVKDNLYAQMVRTALKKAGVPPNANLMLVGHSFGADTALDLASDPTFNGKDYHVTHVVAAGYYSDPQLASVRSGTRVLVLQNDKDKVIAGERLLYVPSSSEPGGGSPVPSDIVVERFNGGDRGAGHHPENYFNQVGRSQSPEVAAFLDSVTAQHYADGGSADSIDVSVPLTPFGGL